jgi:hypothetical protein
LINPEDKWVYLGNLLPGHVHPMRFGGGLAMLEIRDPYLDIQQS